MYWKLLGLAVLVLAPQANALLRFACSQLVIERLDPLLEPGRVSAHLHQVVGGSAFNVTMNPNNDLPTLSQCTTCTYSEDFSNYWTAVLYFKHPNGSYKRVKQLPGPLLGNANGGMTVYYSQPNDGGKVTSFRKGFRMIVGDAMKRAFDSSSPEARSLNFRCLGAGGSNGGVVGDPGTDSNSLPTQKCLGGIRSQIVFPSCWDGKNLDSSSHKSHVAYPDGSACPSTHPVVVPQIFIETVWDTTEFNNMWPSTGQPFVYSMGDPTGTGQHADYVFGWQGDALQRAMDQCNSFGGACTTLKTQSIDAINKCAQTPRINEVYEGWIERLPGCNPIQDGPNSATMPPTCGAPTTFLNSFPTLVAASAPQHSLPLTAAPPLNTPA